MAVYIAVVATMFGARLCHFLQSIHNLDVLTFHWCLKFKYRELAVSLSRVISRSADGHLYILIGLACILFQQWDWAKVLAVGFAIERLFYFSFKLFFKRNRPPVAIPGYKSVIEPSDQFSFPSGHTSAAFFMACFLSVAIPQLSIIFFAWAVGVGVSRVMLGVHFPTDILAGAYWLLGCDKLYQLDSLGSDALRALRRRLASGRRVLVSVSLVNWLFLHN